MTTPQNVKRATTRQAITALVALAALAAVPKQAIVDFYDGYPGPTMFQLDQRLTLSSGEANVGVTYTLLPKAFIDKDNDGTGSFAVVPFSYAPATLPTAGLGGGAFVKLGNNASLLGVVPVLYGGQYRTVTVAPTAYATFGFGNVLVDPRLSYAAVIGNGKVQHNASAGTTIGYQHNRIIVGLDAEISSPITKLSVDSLIDSLAVQGIIRIDLDEQHENWLQTYVTPQSVTGGWRTNF